LLDVLIPSKIPIALPPTETPNTARPIPIPTATPTRIPIPMPTPM
jgi:hypothetical protein